MHAKLGQFTCAVFYQQFDLIENSAGSNETNVTWLVEFCLSLLGGKYLRRVLNSNNGHSALAFVFITFLNID